MPNRWRPPIRGPSKNIATAKESSMRFPRPTTRNQMGMQRPQSKRQNISWSNNTSNTSGSLSGLEGDSQAKQTDPKWTILRQKNRRQKTIISNILDPIANSKANSKAIPKSNNSADSETLTIHNNQRNIFQPGDSVRVQNLANMRWDTKAKIDDVSASGRTLQLTTSEGVKIRWNRRFVRAQCAAKSN